MNIRILMGIFLTLVSALPVMAQIGYQVAVIDQATGKPKVNESVKVVVTITDSSGVVVCSDTQSGITNDFGVISLRVGNVSTFDDVDWRNLPLWVSATVDGVTVGKTQVLAVPVAEYAKHYGTLTPKILNGSWTRSSPDGCVTTYTFYSGSYIYVREEYGVTDRDSGTYEIDGNNVFLYSTSNNSIDPLHYSTRHNTLCTYEGTVLHKGN